MVMALVMTSVIRVFSDYTRTLVKGSWLIRDQPESNCCQQSNQRTIGDFYPMMRVCSLLMPVTLESV